MQFDWSFVQNWIIKIFVFLKRQVSQTLRPHLNLDQIIDQCLPHLNLFLYFPWFTEEKFNAVKIAYKDNGMLIIFLGAFTPLPYKIITITSGIAEVNIFAFILMSILGRGTRFFIVAYLVKFFGKPALLFLQKHLLISSSILGLAIIIFTIYIM